jgi:arylsulfatase A-like enzyme
MRTRPDQAFERAGSAGATSADVPPVRFRPLIFLVLSAWCGLISGLLEVGTIVVRKHTYDTNHLYGMSRHFVWLIPASNLCIFLAMGIGSCLAVRIWPRVVGWLASRWLCALTILPPLLVAFPRIHGLAWSIVALGIAARLVPALNRHREGFRRTVRMSFPVVAGLVAILAASPWVSDGIDGWRERSRPFPPAGSPNVLLIVLDTVAADHLSLHGYHRPTSPVLTRLASRAIRFDSAQAASSWTLPSHASAFTGRWPHEFSANWLTPLDGTYPTVAGFLGSRGYATAGFVGNTLYCASDSGLGRGFTTYRDFIFPRLTPFKPSVLVDRSVAGLQVLGQFLKERLDSDFLMNQAQYLWFLLNADRKQAAVVRGEFLDWLSRRRQPDRPFFAFLNFYDAHYPYQLPEQGVHRFGFGPRNSWESYLIQNWFLLDKRGLAPRDLAYIRNAYDDCVAELDAQLGRLMDELGRRGLLERTWVIIAADHGESFGEHAGVFCHGASVYQTELHVPLLILPPSGSGMPSGRVVDRTVSLRDLAATVVDLAGLRAASPFPGESLARFRDEPSRAPADRNASGRALAEVVPNDPILNPNREQLLKVHWPLAALAEGDWTYIRREGDVREELFHLRADPKETHNLAGDPAETPRLEQMRGALRGLTAGPLTPQRFHP